MVYNNAVFFCCTSRNLFSQCASGVVYVYMNGNMEWNELTLVAVHLYFLLFGKHHSKYKNLNPSIFSRRKGNSLDRSFSEPLNGK